MTRRAQSKWGVLLLAQSIVLLGIFPWRTVAHNRDSQAGLSAFRD